MFLIKNNLTQPLAIGAKALPAGGELEVESVSKYERGLEGRGFISIRKIETEPSEIENEPVSKSQINQKEKK